MRGVDPTAWSASVHEVGVVRRRIEPLRTPTNRASRRRAALLARRQSMVLGTDRHREQQASLRQNEPANDYHLARSPLIAAAGSAVAIGTIAAGLVPSLMGPVSASAAYLPVCASSSNAQSACRLPIAQLASEVTPLQSSTPVAQAVSTRIQGPSQVIILGGVIDEARTVIPTSTLEPSCTPQPILPNGGDLTNVGTTTDIACSKLAEESASVGSTGPQLTTQQIVAITTLLERIHDLVLTGANSGSPVNPGAGCPGVST
jgi:hypothetical protein